MKLAATLITLLMLTGCMAKQEYYDMADSYKGRSIDELVTEQGPPTSEYKKKDGSKVLRYSRDNGSSRCTTLINTDKEGIVQTVEIADEGLCE